MQIRELEVAGCEQIYKDQGISGTRISRPELDRMLDRLGASDEVVGWKLDRLGSRTRHLLELLDDFKSRGIKFRSLRDGIAADPASEVGGAMVQSMVTSISAFAQLERDQLSERTKAGMAVAAANGRKAGRREVTTDHEKIKRAQELKDRGLKLADIGKVHRSQTGHRLPLAGHGALRAAAAVVPANIIVCSRPDSITTGTVPAGEPMPRRWTGPSNAYVFHFQGRGEPRLRGLAGPR
ncbi:recombinase family protein [Arthrobacter bambusae]|uniref:recombinase family protein n=1 Tax=Arthrobacter bambusae TaxID=1338426 RepID=UPI003393F36C